MDGELGVADGDKIAQRALYVGGVADPFEAHLGTDRGYGIHVCFVLVTKLQKAPGVREKRLKQRLVASGGARARSLDKERRRRPAAHSGRAVCLQRQRRRRPRRERWPMRRLKHWRGAGDGLDDAGNPYPDERIGRSGC